MLFRPLSILVLLAFNTGLGFAMFKPTNQYGPGPVLHAGAPSYSQPGMGSVDQNSAAQASLNMPPKNIQVNAPYRLPHEPDLKRKFYLPDQPLMIQEAICGNGRIKIRYTEQQIIDAQEVACSQLPFNFPNLAKGSRLSTRYFPTKRTGKTTASSDNFYLYPMGGPPYYGINRVMINQQCEFIGLVTEVPKTFEYIKKLLSLLIRRPRAYVHQNFVYNECAIKY